jgi:hypothetical protein
MGVRRARRLEDPWLTIREKYGTTMKSRSSELLVSGLYAVSFVLVGPPYATTFTARCILTLMQVGFLFAPPVLAYVFREKDGAASHRKGG